MKSIFGKMALGLVLLSTAATAAPPLSAMSFASAQDHDRDHDQAQYANNPYYQTGQREGYRDYQKKHKRKSHHHKYRNDDDRRAHDAGYEQGWQGQQVHHD